MKTLPTARTSEDPPRTTGPWRRPRSPGGLVALCGGAPSCSHDIAVRVMLDGYGRLEQMKTETTCRHLPATFAEPRSEVCESCASAVNLRVCSECGHVGCCESQQAHNTVHFRESGHPVIKSLPLGERSFTWCYECERYV